MKETILVIEDSKPLLSLLKNILEKNYNVMIKSDGLSAMKWLSEGNFPELILTDYMLPEFNGLELLKNLKLSGAFKDIPVIILSSNTDLDFRVQCYEAGAVNCLEKPINPEVLLRTINNELKNTTKTYI